MKIFRKTSGIFCLRQGDGEYGALTNLTGNAHLSAWF